MLRKPNPNNYSVPHFDPHYNKSPLFSSCLFIKLSEVRAVCNRQPCPVCALWLAHTCTLVSGAGGMWSKHNKSLSRRLNMQEEGLRLHKHKHSANEGLAPIAPVPAGKRIPVPSWPWTTLIKLQLRRNGLQWRYIQTVRFDDFQRSKCIIIFTLLGIVSQLYLVVHSSSPIKSSALNCNNLESITSDHFNFSNKLQFLIL